MGTCLLWHALGGDGVREEDMMNDEGGRVGKTSRGG